jgi:hypothetical protein
MASTHISGLGLCDFITRSSCFVHKKTPVEFTDMQATNFSRGVSVISENGPVTPAKLLCMLTMSDQFFERAMK